MASLRRPDDALAARLALIDDARRTLDLQYYLWSSDAVGFVLLDRLLSAADRGVRVRLIVDDLKLRSRTRFIARLCAHPNMEVRVFNPWSMRSNALTQGLEFAFRFGRLDRRMHNKLFIVDGDRAIFGGRNAAAEHFGLDSRFSLIDFDVLLESSAVTDLSEVFQAFWDAPASVSGVELRGAASEVELGDERDRIARELRRRESQLSSVSAGAATWPARMEELRSPMGDGAVSVVWDDPATRPGSRVTQVSDALRREGDRAEHDLVVVTPFIVPGGADVAWYRGIIDRGVRFRLVTNSLASNQGTISNSGWEQQRRAVVDAGVELHELRTDAATKPDWEIAPNVARYLGLHAKLYIIDRSRVFLGSVNLDPRSKYINTEMGVLVRDAGFAANAADAAIRLMEPDNAWRVEIGPDGGLVWRNDEQATRRQPARGWTQRTADRIFRHLPIHDYI